MRLAEFINANVDRLVADWEAFARSIQPRPAILSDEELKDWAQQVLEAVAEDMQLPETDEEELLRSEGLRPGHNRLTESGSEHATHRLMQGFTIDQVNAEFRAMRASVLRSWLQQKARTDRDGLLDVFRFDQAMDECFANSLETYTKRVERARHLILGALGHDLRSPLSAINAGIEFLLASGDNLTHEQTRIVLRSRNSLGRIRKMIDDLLDFTRTRLGGGLPISPERMNMEESLRNVLDELRAYHAGRELNLEVSGDLSGTWDCARVEQLVSNLVSNALQYGHPGSPVTVIARDEGQEVTFTVHNEGEAIPQETRCLMFDPLTRGGVEAGEAWSKENGIGLGLYIAKQIVETHGGRIELDSRQGAGTTFQVWLPRNPPPPQSPAQE